jgi:biotin transport system substrate-specific component
LSRLSTRELTYVALFSALIAAGAFITIPLGPVPFTLQPLFVLLAGLVLGPRLGALSVVAYLVLGLVAPVYHGGTSGLGVLFGPTGGYLLGFVFGAMVAGAIGRSGDAGTSRLVVGGLSGLLPIYFLGATWLAVSLHTTDLRLILVGGVLQFLPFDIIKAIAAGVLAHALLRSPLGLPAALRGR